MRGDASRAVDKEVWLVVSSPDVILVTSFVTRGQSLDSSSNMMTLCGNSSLFFSTKPVMRYSTSPTP